MALLSLPENEKLQASNKSTKMGKQSGLVSADRIPEEGKTVCPAAVKESECMPVLEHYIVPVGKVTDVFEWRGASIFRTEMEKLRYFETSVTIC